MANMSYCRFTNTTKDMQDCVNAMSETMDDPTEAPLSVEEARSAVELANLAVEYLTMFADYHGMEFAELVNECGDLKEDLVQAVVSNCKEF